MTDPGLVVVVEAFDPAEADSAVLARSERWDPDRQAVLRHHLRLPAASVARAAELLAEEGWLLREPGGSSRDGSRPDTGSAEDGSPTEGSPTDGSPTDAVPTDDSQAPDSPTRDSPAAGLSAEGAPAHDTAGQGSEDGAPPGMLARVDAAGADRRPAAGAAASPSVDGMVRLEAVRVQSLDALHCAQARSRMAGLAQRLGGDALGWDALQA